MAVKESHSPLQYSHQPVDIERFDHRNICRAVAHKTIVFGKFYCKVRNQNDCDNL